MGTRNLTCVWIDGAFKVAQYGQWDGYPGGIGLDILRFLKQTNLDAFKDAVRACHWATKEEVEATWVECGMEKGAEFVSMAISDIHGKKYPEFCRDTAAKILPLILKKPLALNDKHEFAADGLFCEWAYVIDLDAMTLEVYEGFNQTTGKDHGKFAGLPVRDGADKSYTAVVLAKIYKLSELPDVDAFVKDFEHEEVEE